MFRAFFVFIFLAFFSLAQANDVVAQLARAGANDLALSSLAQSLQASEPGSAQWAQLKRQQVELMKARGQYLPLAELLEADIQASSDAASKRWLQNQQINAYLEAGQALQAMHRLRAAIWQHADAFDAESLDAIANWRRQLVEARVLAGQFDLAADTLARYEADYQIESDVTALRAGIQRWPWPYQPRLNQELKRSRARLFLESREFGIVAELLAEDEHPAVQPVRLLSLLRTEQMPAAEVYSQALTIAENSDNGLPMRKTAWVLVAEAARYQGQWPDELQAIKNAMTLAPELAFSEALLSLDADSSWLALEAAGARLMQDWPAEMALDAALLKIEASEFSPAERQAVLAQLYSRSQDDGQRSALLMSLINNETNERARRVLLPQWLLNNAHVDAEQLSAALRYRLTELLLAAGNIPQAAELMALLDAGPEDVPAVQWQLRRARVLILAAKAEQGAEVLQQMLDGDFGQQPATDRFLQAVFDLQAVGAVDDALLLFQRLLDSELSPRQRREMHYWLADAAKASKQYALAAEHYLRSAGEAANSWDQWGQSARRHAAEALKSAGLLADAINIYQRLLDRAQDRTERAVLRTHIQRLQAQL